LHDDSMNSNVLYSSILVYRLSNTIKFSIKNSQIALPKVGLQIFGVPFVRGGKKPLVPIEIVFLKIFKLEFSWFS